METRMKQRFTTGILGVLLFTAAGAKAQSPAPAGSQPPAAQAVQTAQAPAFTPQEVGVDEKLGQNIPLDLVLNDEDGKPVSLRSLVNKPTILTLNYFRCAGICTPQLNGLTEVLNKVQAEPGKDFQVITVSFDDRDTPEMATQKRTNYLGQINRPFPPTAWRFLTGPAATTRALADSVGFKYKRVGDDFIHAGAIMILSPKGEVTRYMYGITYLPADLQMALEEAARGEAHPSINKLLKFCFSYDPHGRKYVVNFTKMAAGLTLLAAAIFLLVLVFKGRGKSKSEEGE
jgi:protein SCO1/2